MSTEDEFSIDRREAIRRVSALLGGVALVGGSAIWTGCTRDRSAVANGAAAGTFTPSDVAFLDEVADTILPDTSTPGAKAAHTGAFMAMMVNDCYDAGDQKIFKAGMQQLDGAARKAGASSFMAATPAQRLSVLQALDQEQKAYMDRKKPDDPSHYFRMMKELTLLGYFTSEIGYTKAQRYVESPGRYEPCVPYKVGDKAWAPHA